MKKIVASVLTILTLFACSSEENSGEEDVLPSPPKKVVPELTGKNNLESYTLSFPSGKKTVHSFDGNKGVDSKKDGVLASKFDYNVNSDISKYSAFIGTNLDYSYTFNYNSSSKLISIDVSRGFDFFKPNDYKLDLEYVGNSIKTIIPKTSMTNYSFEIILNSEGLVKEMIQKEIGYTDVSTGIKEADELFFKESFSYDSNGNCTKVIRAEISPFSNVEVSSEFTYSYDSGVNPLHNFHVKNYIPLLIIYAQELSVFHTGVFNIIEQFGENNHSASGYPSSYTDSAKFTYKNEYNEDGTLKKNIVTNVGSGKVTSEITFKYKE